MEATLISGLKSDFRGEMEEALGGATLDACMSCATCSSGCPNSEIAPDLDPRRTVRSILLGLEDQVMSSRFVWACTMCGRCTMHCPSGISMPTLVRALRARHVRAGTVPAGIQAVLTDTVESGNNMRVTEEDFRESIEWVEEMLQGEVDDPSAKIPVDKVGARIMFTVNPREVKYNPLTFLAVAKVFYAAGEDWTLGSKSWDVTNYGLFAGDDEAATIISGRMADEVRRLQVQELVSAECGHGFWSMKWGMEHWLGGVEFPIRSVVQLVAEYIRDGRITLDPSVNADLATYHDPCNLARKGGVVEEPRYILAHAVQNFKEMYPNGEYNYCCGGGGGLLSVAEHTQLRIAKGAPKADQIRATGASLLVTACHNCLDQLGEINKQYKLKVTIKNICEVVADALVLSKATDVPEEGD